MMKREYGILLLFSGIIAVSGVAIYLIGSSRSGPNPIGHKAESGMQAGSNKPMESQMPPGPDSIAIRKQLSEFESQLKSNPDNYDALVGIANSYYDLGDAHKAIEYYDRAIKINPRDAGVIVDMGAMYRQLNNPDKAVELFNRAIKIDPNLPQAYFNLGMVLRMEKNDRAGAAKAWKKYLELDPNSQARQFLEDDMNGVSGKPSSMPK
jgi:tetratricopeptide (TPR) repeat protein